MKADSWPGFDDAKRFGALLLRRSGTIVELRALGAQVHGGGIVSGYFDDAEKLAEAAASLDGRARGIYVTLNPVNPDLLARACNRLERGPKSTTSDSDVVSRQWILIDADPVRPSGISATDAERQAAFDVLQQVVGFLESRGFPQPVKGDSGNGGHLLYPVDLPADDGGLVERFLGALAFRSNTDAVHIDQKVFNPARITKLFGTLACKGDNVPDRPHRRSRMFDPPGDIQLVPRELLEQVAAELPQDAPRPKPTDTAYGSRLDVDEFLTTHGLEVARQAPWKDGARWILNECPFEPAHTDRSAYIVQFGNGAVAAGCHHNGCAGLGWAELRERLEPDRQNRQSCQKGASVSSVSGVPGGFEKREEPEPLPEGLPPVMALQPRLLPKRIHPWVVDIAERVQCPLIFVAVSAMVALAGVLGRKVGIRPKRMDSWLVVANLWGALIGRPGVMKTPAVTETLRPLKRLEIAAKARFDEEMVVYDATEFVEKQAKKDAEERIRKALKSGDESPHELARKALVSEASAPVRRRHLVNDASVEKLGEILAENPNGVTTFRDELVGLLKQLDKPGQEQARSFYLEAWNGDGRFTYDRIGRGTVDIDCVTMSIIGAIQPGPLSKYLGGALDSGAGDDGLMQRFQLAVWPDIDGEWVNVDRWPDTTAKNEAYAVFEALDGLDPLDIDATKDDFTDDDEIPHLRFSAEAQDRFDEWRGRLERRLRSGEEHPAIESHLAKFRSLIPSLALLIHLADGGTGAVADSALERAIEWGEVLESHARRIYGAVVDRQETVACALGKRILQGQLKDDFDARTVYRKGWTGLSDRKDVKSGLSLLVELGWLREKESTTSGRTKTTYLINPRVHALQEKDTDRTDNADRRSGAGASKYQTPRNPTDTTDKRGDGGLLSVVSVPSGDGSQMARGDDGSRGKPADRTDKTDRSTPPDLPSAMSVDGADDATDEPGDPDEEEEWIG